MKDGTPLGIIGGGQLAHMLVEAAGEIGVQTLVLAESATSPVTFRETELIVGKVSDTSRLKDFLIKASVVVFENEFVDCKLLAKAGSGTRFFPSLPVIELFQDKFS